MARILFLTQVLTYPLDSGAKIRAYYVLLYLATIMFYWWPVGMLSRPLWYVYAGLFTLSTWLNISSH